MKLISTQQFYSRTVRIHYMTDLNEYRVSLFLADHSDPISISYYHNKPEAVNAARTMLRNDFVTAD